jgi:hypothetical protein
MVESSGQHKREAVMQDSKKIVETYKSISADKPEMLAAAGIVQAELFAWIFAKMIKNGWSTEEEVESMVKDLRHEAGPGMQASLYDLVLNRLFLIEKEDV